MKFREKLAREHPECIDNCYDGGCCGCPNEYDYETTEENIEACTTLTCQQCWDREIPGTEKQKTNEMVNHPAHYNTGKREVIEEMRILFGDEQVRSFCKLNAYKCIRRAEHKGNPLEDLKKAEWYMDYLEGMDKKDEK